MFFYDIPFTENFKFENRDHPNVAYENKIIEFREDKSEPTARTFIVGTNTIRSIFKPKSQNRYIEGTRFYLLKNLYIQVGIPFDPKWFYKDEIC